MYPQVATPRPLWLRALGLCLAYTAGIAVSRFVSNPSSPYISIWLPAGIFVTALILADPRDWVALVLVVAAVDIGSDLQKGSPLLLSVLVCAVNAVQAVMGALLFRRFVSKTARVNVFRDFFGLIACTAVVSAALAATLGASIVVGFHFNPSYWDAWSRWWIANAMAILLTVPFALIWVSPCDAKDRWWTRPRRLAEAALIVCGICAVAWHVMVRGQGVMAPGKAVPVLFILWSASRFGLRGASAANLVLALVLIFLASHYLKGLSPEQASSGSYIPVMQVYIAVCAMAGLVPAIAVAEKQAVVKQLEKSEERYRSVIEAMPEAVTVHGGGKIVYANRAALRMFGASSTKDLLGRRLLTLVHPDSRETVLARGKRVSENGAGGSASELRFLKLDGAPIDVEVQSVAVLFDGAPCVQVTSREIGSRKQAEEALKLSEFSVRESSVPTFWVGRDARMLRVNRAACELLGYTEAELLALTVLDFDTKWNADLWPAHWRELREQRRMLVESCLRPKAGPLIPVELNLNWFEFNGREYNFAFIHDITERKRAEAGLRESEAKLRAMFEGSKDAIGVTKNGIHVFVNPAYLRLYGLEGKGPVVGTSVLPCTAPSHRAQVAEAIRRRAAGEPVPRFYESRGIKADGTEFDTELSISTYEMDGELYSVAHIRDITERRVAEEARARLEEQLRQSQKHEAIGTLASGIAHDFNNILAGIYGFTALARESAGSNAEVRDYIDEIGRASYRAKELVQQILAFSRKADGDEAMGPVPLGHVVAEACKLLRASTPSTIELTKDLRPDVPLVQGNATQLHQVVMNLGTNAVQALRDRTGRLSVSLKACIVTPAMTEALPGLTAGPHVLLTVRDTGRGMDKATQMRIYEPFFTTKGPGEGTGLGLSVVYGIVHNHHGAIRLTSEVDRGTTFEIFLPAAAPVKQVEHVEPLVLPRGNGERILFVDDEKPIVRVGELTLRRLGYAVDGESQVAEALARLERDPQAYQLVIADQTMPGMTGLEFALRIRDLRPDLPVVLATGHSDDLTPERVKAAGVREVMAKPYAADVLAGLARRHLPPVAALQPS
jgi:PAS domain S-box-containing protein